MQWVTIVSSMVAAACLTLAAMHLRVWLSQRHAWAHLLVSCSAVSAAVFAGFELAIMRAQSPQEQAQLIRWSLPALFTLTVSLVLFIRSYLNAGRPWLAAAVIVGRALTVILNFAHSPNLHFRQMTGMVHMKLPGGEVISLVQGQPSPWTLVGQLSTLLLLVFLVDAMVDVWRRGDRRRAIVICGSTILFVTLALATSALVIWGVVRMPLVISIAYMGVVAAMTYELGSDLARSAALAHELQSHKTALNDSEQRLDLAASASGLAAWSWDIVNDEIWLSEQGQRIFGLDMSAGTRIRFDRFLQAVHADDRELVVHAIANSMNGDGDYESEYRVLASDGQSRWIAGRGRVEFNGNGKPSRVRGVSLDITARKRTEEALRRSEEQFRQIVEGAPNAMVMVDARGEITLVNAQFEAIFGYPREELMGRPIETLVPEPFRRDHPQYREEYQVDAKPRLMGSGRELFAVRKDGSQIPVEIGLNPVRTSGVLYSRPSLT